MSVPSSSSSGGSPSQLLAGVVLGGLLASWLDMRSFAGYVAVTVAAAVFVATAGYDWVDRVAASLAAVAYPLSVVEAGETGLLWAFAGSFVLIAGASVIRGLRRNALATLGTCVLTVIYFGSFGSFFVLIRGFQAGSRMLTALFLLVLAQQAIAGAIDARLTKPAARRITPDLRAVAAGMAACTGLAIAARMLLKLPVEIPVMAVIGLVVGAATAIGQAAALLAAQDLAGQGLPTDARLFGTLNGLLFAAPAYFYALRLYLS